MAARPKAGPIVAVGSRATVTRPTGSAAVTLTDANGIGSLATLAEGAEVEILAWQPQRAGGTRYRVRTTEGTATEGWLSAFQLTPRPIVVAPPRPAPERIAPKRASASRTTAAARTATAAAARKR